MHFVSDSVAFCISGCEAHQRMVQLNYSQKSTGELVFQKIKAANFEPIYSIEPGKVSFSSYDSLVLLPKIVIANNDSIFWSEAYWTLTANKLVCDSGTLFSNIPIEKLVDSSSYLRIIPFEKLKSTIQPIDLSHFVNTPDQILIRVLFPVHFLNYSDLQYSDDVCDLNLLKLKRVKNQLYILNERKQWIDVKQFKGFPNGF
ncbi:hypothetical protein D3C71_909140 [compost metagenome]